MDAAAIVALALVILVIATAFFAFLRARGGQRPTTILRQLSELVERGPRTPLPQEVYMRGGGAASRDLARL